MATFAMPHRRRQEALGNTEQQNVSPAVYFFDLGEFIHKVSHLVLPLCSCDFTLLGCQRSTVGLTLGW